MKNAPVIFTFLFFQIWTACSSGSQPKTLAAVEQATLTSELPPQPETAENQALEKPEPEPELPTTDELMGKLSPEKHPDFVKLEKPYTEREGMFLRKEAAEAFKKMWEAAKADGVRLNVISATRNFDRQKTIWDGKWKRYEKSHPKARDRALKILEYSAMPGTSRHHWGTDVDLNLLENKPFEEGGREEATYRWLAARAHEFGFCQPYTTKDAARPDGYNEEKWHWSYTPLAKPFLKKYLEAVGNEMISGFRGAEAAGSIDAVGKYAGGINKACQ